MNRSNKIISLVATGWMGLSFLFPTSSHAQEGPPLINMDSLKTIKMSPARLKAFEGFYQSPQNKELVVQFKTVGDSLVASLTWNDFKTTLIPVSDTGFVTSKAFGDGGRHLAISFIRNQKGAFTKMQSFNDEPWLLVKDYKPVVKKEINHTPAQLKPLEGLYEIEGGRGLFMQLTETDNKLVMRQYWSGNQMVFVPDSAMHFFNREQPLFTLQFSKDSSGNITQLQALGNNNWNKRTQAHFTTQQLKSFEGKFRFKDDHDDIVRIVAKDAGLVVKQLWDGKEITLEPKSELFFYCPTQSYSLYFSKNKDGVVTQVMILNNDIFEKIDE